MTAHTSLLNILGSGLPDQPGSHFPWVKPLTAGPGCPDMKSMWPSATLHTATFSLITRHKVERLQMM